MHVNPRPSCPTNTWFRKLRYEQEMGFKMNFSAGGTGKCLSPPGKISHYLTQNGIQHGAGTTEGKEKNKNRQPTQQVGLLRVTHTAELCDKDGEYCQIISDGMELRVFLQNICGRCEMELRNGGY